MCGGRRRWQKGVMEVNGGQATTDGGGVAPGEVREEGEIKSKR